ncbi:ABC-2 family transporter protein [Candidatus Micrarchaeota archaeon]|nr:ABC-2 family transporter protein [Candidatus Micrarchaeota archaeon]
MGLRLILRLLRVRFKENMEYRIGWVFMFLTTLTSILTGIVFWFMLSDGEGFHGWSYPELILLSTIGLLSREITYVIGIDPWIKELFKERLTVYMTKPVRLLRYLCLRHGDLLSTPGILTSLVTLWLVPHVYHVDVDLPLFLVFFIFSVFIHAALFFIILIVGLYWYDTAEAVDEFIYSLLFLCRNPIDKIKTGLFSVILYPLLFVSVFPSHAFAGELTASPLYISEVFLGFILIFWIEYKLWERGLKKYESFGG